MLPYKRYLFIAASIIVAAALSLFLFPLFTHTVIESDAQSMAGLQIRPAIGHYATINIRASNVNNVHFPRGTAEIEWGNSPHAREKFHIYIDNMAHTYHVPLGENIHWQAEDSISRLSLSLPRMEGIEYEVENIKVNNRSIFPLDSHINSYFKNLWRLEGINRFLVPSYILVLFTGLAVLVYRHMFKSPGLNPLLFVCIAVLGLFSVYFFTAKLYTARSYYIAYEQQIQERDFASTYQGFHDFRAFISWVEQKLPEGENLAVLLSGEPVYIMSEMAYNLYPRDIRFINTSQKSSSDIVSEIRSASREGYPYIVILSGEDRVQSSRLSLLDSYREEAGHIYKFSSE